jgi:hypothetical protein
MLDTDFIENTTFAKICKLMKKDGCIDKELVKSIFDTSLLFLPSIMCPEVASLTNIAMGVSLVGAKNVITNFGAQIKGLFVHDKNNDYATCYERAQTAQVLLVFSAYFDVIRDYLPNETREIVISPEVKFTLTETSLASYINKLKKQSTIVASEEASQVLEYNLAFPSPLESIDEYHQRLLRFYKILNKHFVDFVCLLTEWKCLPKEKQELFFSCFNRLPDAALENYKKQYTELKTESVEFRIWADTQTYRHLSSQVDIGFKTLTCAIQSFYEKFNNNGIKLFNKFSQVYQDYIIEKLISVNELDDSVTRKLCFPLKKDIFIPQNCRALCYKKGMLLESEKTWTSSQVEKNVGSFIAATLRHSMTGNLPLLLLGGPGSGKTLLCYMLAAQVLCSEYHILIIKLRDVVADHTIVEQINEQIRKEIGPKTTWEEMADQSVSKPVLLIIDGYDELLQASGKTYADYINRIVEFQHRQLITSGVLVKCILTSRITLINKVEVPDGSIVIKLSDFNDEQIGTWIKIWNDANENYFKTSNVRKFTIDSKSKVFELARQPLLLLLLALYDADENTLSNDTVSTRAQLYERLIKRFIEREQKKSSSFSNYTELERFQVIDRELERLSVAAVGMHNRRALYIRDVELQKDLDFLITQTDVMQANKTPGNLKESEKLLGSFFFIYRSEAKTDADEKKSKVSKNAAYEFLHNTFGEFLIVNYIMAELSKIIIGNIITRIDINEANEQLVVSKSWFTVLAYAPIFTRPVIVVMLKEWAGDYLEERGMSKDSISGVIHPVLEKEIDNVVNGKTFSALDKFLAVAANPYPQKKTLYHLGCYSLNLLCIGTLVCDDANIYRCNNKIWDYLISIWRYTFTEDELLDFANLFITERDVDSCGLRSKGYEDDIGPSLMPIRQLSKINRAIGDMLSYAFISTIIGEGDIKTVLKTLEQNNLDISFIFILNQLRCTMDKMPYEKSLYKHVLDYVRETYLKQGTPQDVILYYFLLNHLLKYDKDVLGYDFYIQAIEMAIRAAKDYERWDYHESLVPGFYEHYQEILFSIIKRTPCTYILQSNLVRCCIENRNSEILLRITSLFLKYIQDGVLSKADFYNLIEDDYIVSAFRDYGEYIILCFRRGKHYELTAGLNLIFQIIRYAEAELKHKIMIRILYRDLIQISKMVKKLTAEEKALFIRCILKLKEIEDLVEGFQLFCDRVLEEVSVKEIFEYSPDAAYDFCCLLKQQNLEEREEVRNDLRWIQQNFGEEISVKFARKIKELALTES